MEGLHREGQNAELCALSLWSQGASPPSTTLCSWSESSPQLSVQRSCQDFITVLRVTDAISSTSPPPPRPRAGFGPKTLDLHQELGVPGEQAHPEATSPPQHKASISITKTFIRLWICAGFLKFCARNQAQRPGIFMIMPHCLREVPYRASFGEDSSECSPSCSCPVPHAGGLLPALVHLRMPACWLHGNAAVPRRPWSWKPEENRMLDRHFRWLY